MNSIRRFRVIFEDCICCSACAGIAPDHFRAREDWTHEVYRQPVRPEELASCIEAMGCCPTEAIADDAPPCMR
ncbi:MAG: ferredoxin [Myxococcota bacterium]